MVVYIYEKNHSRNISTLWSGLKPVRSRTGLRKYENYSHIIHHREVDSINLILIFRRKKLFDHFLEIDKNIFFDKNVSFPFAAST